jgi:CheY-like chemotaxis protein
MSGRAMAAGAVIPTTTPRAVSVSALPLDQLSQGAWPRWRASQRVVIVGLLLTATPGISRTEPLTLALKVIVTAADELPTDQSSLMPVDVLLVEDDPGDSLMTREAFEQRGMRNRLHVVSDGEQAIEFLRRAGDFTTAPTPGLILLDLNLPRRNGFEVLAEVKSDSELRRIPVVVLTTSHAEQDIVRSYSLHANAYVTKPIDFDRFMNTIGQIDDFTSPW